MRNFSTDYRWLSINTATVRRQHGSEWPLLEIIDACARHGIRAISPWRAQPSIVWRRFHRSRTVAVLSDSSSASGGLIFI